MPEYTIERKNDVPLKLNGTLLHGNDPHNNRISTYNIGTWLFQTNAGNFLLVESRRDGTNHSPVYVYHVIPHPDKQTTNALVQYLGSARRADPILKILGKRPVEEFE